MRGIRQLAAGLMAAAVVAGAGAPAEAFSSFKGRYGNQCPQTTVNPCEADFPGKYTDSGQELPTSRIGDLIKIRTGYERDVVYECTPDGWDTYVNAAGTVMDDGPQLCERKLTCTGKIRLGRRGDNYYTGYCKFIHQKLRFTLGPDDRVDRFRVGQVGFDDWVEIKLNSHLIYRGAYNRGGDIRPAPGRNIQFGNTGRRMACEQSTSWVKNVNREAKHYARPGQNVYSMLLVVAGGGELWADVKADFTLRSRQSDVGAVCPKFTTTRSTTITDTVPEDWEPEDEEDVEDDD